MPKVTETEVFEGSVITLGPRLESEHTEIKFVQRTGGKYDGAVYALYQAGEMVVLDDAAMQALIASYVARNEQP